VTGDRGPTLVGATEVGVVETLGEIGAEEKWSDCDSGSNSSWPKAGERRLREEMCEANDE